MKPKYYSRVSKLFLALSILLFLISIGSAISTIITEYPLKLSINNQGFENIVIYFSFTIRTLTATLATFVIWLTLERLSQTERQIDAIMDNNKFNNYSKHQQEFIDQLKESSLFGYISIAENIAPRVFIAPLYKTYYAESYLDFKPHMKDKIKNDIEVFYKIITSSKMSEQGCNLANYPIDEILEISKSASEHVEELIIPNTETIILKIKMKHGVSGIVNPSSALQSVITRFQCLHKIFWTIAFYSSLLVFDGELRTWGHFQDNHENFMNNLGIK